jgi:hypothetical protein
MRKPYFLKIAFRLIYAYPTYYSKRIPTTMKVRNMFWSMLGRLLQVEMVEEDMRRVVG